MTVHEATTTEQADDETPAETASVAYAAKEVADDLRKVYLAVVAASALLVLTSHGSAHPALRRARRCGKDAIELAVHAEELIGEGVAELRTQLGDPNVTSIGRVAGALDLSRTQFAEAAERVAGFPERLRAAGQRLRDADDPELDPDTAIRHWSHASDQLVLLTESLTGAVSALSSYTDRLTGATS
ncbi:hypothetical protein ACN27G_01525 [Plantactinospora sp. WMMB334]|uniref:hypothetical protein n=1 Tax=Plantactinospora sp. WMMB334 TaxID=3404119 RepID=UPI003B9400BE